MPVPILKQGAILIATVQAALTDSDTERLRQDLMERVSRFRAQGIIVDVTAIDVMDSFAARSLRTIAHMTRLRGADTVIVGLQPEVAFAMVQLGLAFDDMHTALDLEEGLALLNRQLALRQSPLSKRIGRDGGG
jgi:rsbT antagonist protein RsbS